MLFERQQYQEDCVSNIIDVLKDTDNHRGFSQRALGELQKAQSISIKNTDNERRLDVLMETGTGKTFTYLKTMYEMNKHYGINKFVVFVPRIAIRAVVLQNVDLTADYFFQQYGKRVKKHIYGDKGGLSQVEDYIRNNDELSVLILTGASITGRNDNDRILTSRSENLLYDQQSPLDAISKLNPVVFIDEPHLLKGEGFVNADKKYFANALHIRFGATFPTDKDSALSNVVYTLDSITSFCEYLVKKIRVTTIDDHESDIKFYRNADTPPQHVNIAYFQNGIKHRRTVRHNVNIAAITGDNNYNFQVLRTKGDDVFLSDKTKRKLSTNDYKLTDVSIREMIKSAIAIHFEKEEELFSRHIKALSLFFIPGIEDFRGDNPRIKKIFDEEYREQRNLILKKDLSPAYRDYLQQDYGDDGQLRVREGYFSGDSGSAEAKESHGVNLILNDKPKLLSTAEPLRFIFSVWALQEGWDNPNIFTICKLATTNKDTSRRQQVGRGLRLAVNHDGKRQTIKHCGDNEDCFYRINMLDVIVSGHEQNFIEEIQNEIIGNSLTHNRLTSNMLKEQGLTDPQISRLTLFLEDKNVICPAENNGEGWTILTPIADCLEENREELHSSLAGVCDDLIKAFRKAATLPVENRNKKAVKIGIRAERFKQFEELWKTITSKAKIVYRNIDDDLLIKAIKTAFDKEHIPPVKATVITKTYHHHDNSITSEESPISEVNFFRTRNYVQFITDFAGKENLPLHFCHNMFGALDEDKIKKNPPRALELLTTILKDTIHKTVIQEIGYEFNGEIAVDSRSVFYEDADCQKPKKEIDANKIGLHIDKKTTPASHYLYDTIVFDSQIEREVIGADHSKIDNDTIVVFAKLPKISIPTPYKSYSPDFAYFIENKDGKKLFLIVETKGYKRESDIPDDEQRKIQYAKRFFAALRKQTSVNIVFKQRINHESLGDLLRNLGDSEQC